MGGRGLVGRALAQMGVPTTLTDLEPDVCEALRSSLDLAAGAAPVDVRQLDWDDGLDGCGLEDGPGLLIGTELLWADDAVDALWEALEPAVREHHWELVHGSSLRPSNKDLLRRFADAAGTELTTSAWFVQKRCVTCQGWRTSERCVTAAWHPV